MFIVILTYSVLIFESLICKKLFFGQLKSSFPCASSFPRGKMVVSLGQFFPLLLHEIFFCLQEVLF